MLTAESKVKAHPEVVDTTLPNREVVLLHLGTKRYYSLNQTGSLIWQLLGRGLSMRQIGKDLENAFEVTPEEARQSVLDLVTELVNEKLALPVSPG